MTGPNASMPPKPYHRRWEVYLRGERIGEVLALTEQAACLRAVQRYKIREEDRRELAVRRGRTADPFGSFSMLDYLLSLVSLEAIVNGLISAFLFAIGVGIVAYLWQPLRRFLSSSAEANRRYALADIRKRVRSDEYHAERQKIEIHSLIIGTGSIVAIGQFLPLYQAGDPNAPVVWMFVLLLFVSGALFYMETRYNGAALKMGMRREERRRAKRLREIATG